MPAETYILSPILQTFNNAQELPVFLNNLLYSTTKPDDLLSPSSVDEYGISVAISNDYYVVGMPKYDYYDDVYTRDAGMAIIYDKATGDVLHVLENPSEFPKADSWFGLAVAQSNEYTVVAARESNVYDSEGTYVADGGAIFVYENSTGNLLHSIYSPAMTTRERLGWFIDISSDNKIAVRGVGVYVYDAATGQQLLHIQSPNPLNASAAATALAIEGDTLVIGFDSQNVESVLEGIAVQYSVSTGQLIRTFYNPRPTPEDYIDRFGRAVGVSQSYIVIGSADRNAGTGDSLGAVYIFDKATGQQLHYIKDPDVWPDSVANDGFGLTIAMTDQYLVVPAAYESIPWVPQPGGVATEGQEMKEAGVVYIFDPATGTLLHTITDPVDEGLTVNNRFGRAVGIHGTHVVASASYQTTGEVFVYE